MPVSWVNQIKHPEPLYLYLLYGTHCHLEYTCFLLQYSIYHTRITSVCTCRLYCTVYSVHCKQYSQMFYQQNIFCSYVTRGNNKFAGPMFKQYKMNSNLSFHVFLRPSYDSFFHWPQIFQF